MSILFSPSYIIPIAFSNFTGITISRLIQQRWRLTGTGISIMQIWQSQDHLIFTVVILIFDGFMQERRNTSALAIELRHRSGNMNTFLLNRTQAISICKFSLLFLEVHVKYRPIQIDPRQEFPRAHEREFQWLKASGNCCNPLGPAVELMLPGAVTGMFEALSEDAGTSAWASVPSSVPWAWRGPLILILFSMGVCHKEGAILVSLRCPVTLQMSWDLNPFPASTVQLVALSESSAAREMFFIMSGKVFMPTALFAYHLPPSHFTFGHWRNASHC